MTMTRKVVSPNKWEGAMVFPQHFPTKTIIEDEGGGK